MLKDALKDALLEVLQERRDLFREIVEDVLADFDYADELQRHGSDERLRSVFSVLEGEA